MTERRGKRPSESWLGDVDRGLLTLAGICLMLFLALTAAVAVNSGPLFFDRPLSSAVQSADSPLFGPFNSVVSAMGGSTGVAVGAGVILLTFFCRRPATPLVAFSAVYSLIYNGVNFLVRRPRPTGLAHMPGPLGGYSFPSGHTGMFVWLGVLAMLLLVRPLPRPWSRIAAVVAVLLVVLAALSRIDVGAHWPSDVLGGLLVGVGWMALSLSIGRLTKPVIGDSEPLAVLRGDGGAQ